MTEAELIARQALRIAELEEQLKDYSACLRDIDLTLHCIGGPLNDNVLMYSQKQLGVFHRIAESIAEHMR